MNNSFFSRFAPKEPKFFPLFNSMTELLIEAGDLLKKCISSDSYDETIRYFNDIKNLERRADDLSQTIFDELNTTFITPFDREDINELASRLYDNIHGINSCAKRIALYNPKKYPEKTILLADMIQQAAQHVQKAVGHLNSLKKNGKEIKEHCKELHLIENKADDVYEFLINKIFREEKDAVEIIKLKEIINELENTTDASDLVGKTIRTIIVKYT